MIEIALARYLASLGLATVNEGDIGGDVFVGHMPQAPDVAVSIVAYGAAPQPTNNPTSLPRVQIVCRGDKDDPIGPRQRALAIFDALACLDGALLDAGGPDEAWLIGCTPLQSHPFPLGADEKSRHEVACNYELRTHHPSAHRPAIPA